MQKIWDVAPPLTWAVLAAASVLLLAGFVLLSHSLLRRKAHGDEFAGPLAAGRLEWTVRLGAACLLGGSGLWAWELRAPGELIATLGAAALVALGLEVAARLGTTSHHGLDR